MSEILELMEQNKDLINNYESLINAIRKNEALIESHIGRRANDGQVHLTATFETDGLLSFTDKGHIDMRCNYAITKDQDKDGGNVSVLSLGIGLWIGRAFKDRPGGVDDSLCLVDIKGAGGGQFRKITFYWLSAGKVYTRFIYSSIDSQWCDGLWIDIPLLNGYTGTCFARRERINTMTLVEINFNIERANGITALPFAKLGTGYTNTSGRPQFLHGVGFIKDSELTRPLTTTMNSSGEIITYRDDVTTEFQRVQGSGMFLR